MKFVRDSVPDVSVVSEKKPMFAIQSMRHLDESEDKVILKCAEYVEQFKRGFVCDLITYYNAVDKNRDNKEEHSDTIKDLVLVHVNKYWNIEEIPEFEYVFFK